MSSTFPLFRLPQLVIAIVIQLLGLTDLVMISLCSKRAKNIVKQTRAQSNKLQLSFMPKDYVSIDIYRDSFAEEYLTIRIFHDSMQNEPTQMILNVGNVKVPAIRIKDNFHNPEVVNSFDTYWSDLLIGSKALVDFLTSILRCSIHSLGLSDGLIKPRPIIDWILERHNAVIKHCYVNCHGLADTEISHFLNSCRIMKRLYSNVNPTDLFQYTFLEDLKMKSVQMENCFWFSLDNLFAMNSLSTDLSNTRLTNIDINLFLKHWMRGGSSRIKFIHVEMGIIDLVVLLKDTDAVERDMSVVRSYKNLMGFETPVYGGFDIKRNDGRIGTIVHPGGDDVNLSTFVMIVWE